MANIEKHITYLQYLILSSVYLVHDELKDKQFELELSWVSKGTGGKHELVPPNIAVEAETQAKQALADIEDSDEGDM